MSNIKLNFIHVCDNAFVSNDGNKLNIIGIFENIHSESYPAIHPKFSIVTGISALAGSHNIDIKIFKDEESDPITNVGGTIKIPEQESGGNFIANFIGVVFSEKGRYRIKVYSDEDELTLDKETIINLK